VRPHRPPHTASRFDSSNVVIYVECFAGAFVRSVYRWNGVCSANGKFGLYAPDRGGLELLDLKTGLTVHCLIPRVAEGVFSTISLFTGSDQHVVYYHSGRRSIRVFRVSDGRQIADYKVSFIYLPFKLCVLKQFLF